MSEQLFYTVKQVATMLSVSTETIRQAIKRGELLKHNYAGIRISKEDLADYLRRHRCQGQDEASQDSASVESKASRTGTSSGRGIVNLSAYQRAQKMKRKLNNSLPSS